MSSNQVMPAFFQHLPAHIREVWLKQQGNSELSEGVAAGFATLRYKGKVWRLKSRGEERMILDPATQEPIQGLRGVLVKASNAISKVFYDTEWVDGETPPPTCASTNGVRPDEGTAKISPTCASCPNNVFGSQITKEGKKAKACADTRRTAFLAEADLATDDAPALLTVPAMSLGNFAEYGDMLNKACLHYSVLVTRLSFDPAMAYPRITCKPTDRFLTPEELAKVQAWASSDLVDRMLYRETVAATHDADDLTAQGSNPAGLTATARTAPAAAPAPAPVAGNAGDLFAGGVVPGNDQEDEEEDEDDEDAGPAPQPATPAPAPEPAPVTQVATPAKRRRKAAEAPAPAPAPAPEPARPALSVIETENPVPVAQAPADLKALLGSLLKQTGGNGAA